MEQFLFGLKKQMQEQNERDHQQESDFEEKQETYFLLLKQLVNSSPKYLDDNLCKLDLFLRKHMKLTHKEDSTPVQLYVVNNLEHLIQVHSKYDYMYFLLRYALSRIKRQLLTVTTHTTECIAELNRYIVKHGSSTQIENLLVLFNTRLGGIYFATQHYQMAWEAYDNALRINPQFSTVLYNQGLLSYRLRDYRKSIRYYSEAIKINKNYMSAYLNRGNSYYQLHDYENAIADFTAALNLHEGYQAYFNRGLGHFANNQDVMAFADMIKATENEPDNMRAKHFQKDLRASIKDSCKDDLLYTINENQNNNLI